MSVPTLFPMLLERSCNGAVLNAGDTVTLIKDLVVKGANFTAKRGTAVIIPIRRKLKAE